MHPSFQIVYKFFVSITIEKSKNEALIVILSDLTSISERYIYIYVVCAYIYIYIFLILIESQIMAYGTQIVYKTK